MEDGANRKKYRIRFNLIKLPLSLQHTVRAIVTNLTIVPAVDWTSNEIMMWQLSEDAKVSRPILRLCHQQKY